MLKHFCSHISQKQVNWKKTMFISFFPLVLAFCYYCYINLMWYCSWPLPQCSCFMSMLLIVGVCLFPWKKTPSHWQIKEFIYKVQCTEYFLCEDGHVFFISEVLKYCKCSVFGFLWCICALYIHVLILSTFFKSISFPKVNLSIVLMFIRKL